LIIPSGQQALTPYANPHEDIMRGFIYHANFAGILQQ
jgi:hypothetical protein